LSRAPVDGNELEEKAALESAYFSAMDLLRGKRAVLEELEETCAHIKEDLAVQVRSSYNEWLKQFSSTSRIVLLGVD